MQPYGTGIAVLEMLAIELLEFLDVVGSELNDVALYESVELDNCAEDEFAEIFTSDEEDCCNSADDSGDSEDEL